MSPVGSGTRPAGANSWQTPRIETVSDAMATSDEKSAPIRNALASQ